MTVRPHKYKSGKKAWLLDMGNVKQEDGTTKRVQLYFPTQDLAIGEKRKAEARRESHGNFALQMSEATRIRYAAAEKRLAAIGATIEQAVAHFEKTKKPLKEPIQLSAALELCISEKELLGEKKRSLQTFRCSCLSFVRANHGMKTNEPTREHVQKWILANGWEPKTQRNYLGDLRVFFAWLVDEDYAETNACAAEGKKKRVKLAKMVESEITAYDPGRCERLLFGALNFTEPKFNKHEQKWQETHVFRPLLGYITLAVFGGIRPEEVQKSKRAAVDLETKTALVTGAISKTSKTRVVELCDAGCTWFSLWLGVCPDETKIIPKNFRRLWERLRTRLDMFKANWPHDVLRHTFASMHFATHKNASKLKAELGHSENEDTLERFYKAVRTIDGTVISPRIAKKFWNLYAPPRYAEAEESNPDMI